MIKAGDNLKCTLDVEEYGSISIKRAGTLTRVLVKDTDGPEIFFDLTNDELISLRNALSMYVED